MHWHSTIVEYPPHWFAQYLNTPHASLQGSTDPHRYHELFVNHAKECGSIIIGHKIAYQHIELVGTDCPSAWRPDGRELLMRMPLFLNFDSTWADWGH